jgi:hypothetical protein
MERDIVCENAKYAGNALAILLVILSSTFERMPDCLCDHCPQLFEIVTETIKLITTWQSNPEYEQVITMMMKVRGWFSPVLSLHITYINFRRQYGTRLLHGSIPYQIDTTEIYNKELFFEKAALLLYQLMNRSQSR